MRDRTRPGAAGNVTAASVGARSGVLAGARARLADEGLAARKRLGQHFLVDRSVVERMVALADVGSQDAILEIGPGLGALTDLLAARAARLYLIEVDRGLCAVLRRTFAAMPEVRIVEGDALKVDLRGIVTEGSAKVVASLPYNVAMPILFRLLDERAIFPDWTIMVQREVAERLLAAPGTPAYGVPSLLFQLYARPLGCFRVSSAAFYPRPRVASEVLRLALAPGPCVPLEDPRLFTLIVRAAFNQRRKMLHNAVRTLAPSVGLAPATWEAIFAETGIDSGVRGETLDLAAFAALTNAAARAGATSRPDSILSAGKIPSPAMRPRRRRP